MIVPVVPLCLSLCLSITHFFLAASTKLTTTQLGTPPPPRPPVSEQALMMPRCTVRRACHAPFPRRRIFSCLAHNLAADEEQEEAVADGSCTRGLLRDDARLTALLTARFEALRRERMRRANPFPTRAEVVRDACAWGDAAGLPPPEALRRFPGLDNVADGDALVTEFGEFRAMATHLLRDVATWLQSSPVPHIRLKEAVQTAPPGGPAPSSGYWVPEMLVMPADAVPGALGSNSVAQACASRTSLLLHTSLKVIRLSYPLRGLSVRAPNYFG